MGRIKTKLIKGLTNDAYALHKESFTIDFKDNKTVINKTTGGDLSKKLRNTIAGYATRMKRRDIRDAL